jgi:hypothetical protein
MGPDRWQLLASRLPLSILGSLLLGRATPDPFLSAAGAKRQLATWIGRAIQDPNYQAKVQQELAEVRDTCAEKIDAFFAAHPEYRATEG